MACEHHQSEAWKTKPTDRFILRWIKCNLSAPITVRLDNSPWVRPWIITVTSALLGVIGGVVYALGFAWPAGLIAGASQILDGVDGQYARLTGTQSRAGAFSDSVLDRFTDGAMVIGMVIYLVRMTALMPLWILLILGALAVIGSNGISYSTVRAETLDIDLGKPTLASKGTRSTVVILCALGAVFWPALPVVALIYLAVHPNAVIIMRLMNAYRIYGPK